MTLLSMITLGEGLTLLSQVVGFGLAAYKFGRWHQSIEDKFAAHQVRLDNHDRRLRNHGTYLHALSTPKPSEGSTS